MVSAGRYFSLQQPAHFFRPLKFLTTTIFREFRRTRFNAKYFWKLIDIFSNQWIILWHYFSNKILFIDSWPVSGEPVNKDELETPINLVISFLPLKLYLKFIFISFMVFLNFFKDLNKIAPYFKIYILNLTNWYFYVY